MFVPSYWFHRNFRLNNSKKEHTQKIRLFDIEL